MLFFNNYFITNIPINNFITNISINKKYQIGLRQYTVNQKKKKKTVQQNSLIQ